jgi:hypothetical protein
VRKADLDPITGKLKAGVPIEPLVLRAGAGDCINVTLENRLPTAMPDLPQLPQSWQGTVKRDRNSAPGLDHLQQQPDPSVQPCGPACTQLLAYDITKSDGCQRRRSTLIQTVAAAWQATAVRLPDPQLSVLRGAPGA